MTICKNEIITDILFTQQIRAHSNSAGGTVSQQPSGNDNLYTGDFYVFSAC